ncbi:glucose-1-phosphate thymidylyltransferase [Halobacteriales archaeon QS_8_65_32]|jgi:bifunctional UDP-N-acetylglucosamine pyrophosphorylase/glucosamine-1-phosphate N-acetyltransferase|nr:MAG: glucose-1-phosphate thymidylyltransferase [Halobacteriales archaeon QS_8_65_32]
MQTVILAAGEGTRMRPLTANLPKPMLPIADRPLVAHTAEAAVDAGTDELIFVVGYEADVVREYFGEEYQGAQVNYAIQEGQEGTADAVAAARDYLEGDFCVLNGDDLYDRASIATLFDSVPSVGAYRADEPSNYGVLTVDGGRVTGIVEKPDEPDTDLVNAGAYAFPAEAREWLDVPKGDRGEREITDVLARAIKEREVSYAEIGRWLGVGRPWELLEANEWKLADLDRDVRGEVADDADLRGTVVVEEGATIEPGVVIEGPVLIRSGARVGPNAYVRGATLLGANSRVGQSVEVKNSVIMADSKVPHLSYVGDSLLGQEVNFGAGTTVANLRHDDEAVEQTVKGERTSTGRRKYGVVVGDGTKTGIDTTLYPGVVLSAGARTEPNETVSRDR